MERENVSAQVAALEARIAELNTQLEQAKGIVQQWTETGAALSRSAAEARAKNQGAGRGLFGALLGSKFRGAVRTAAAASNAAIAKDVAAKRTQIADGKQQAQDAVREVQAQLAAAKGELKALVSSSAHRAKHQTTRNAADSLSLLQKLKKARDDGLLTEQEFEEKRRKLVSDL